MSDTKKDYTRLIAEIEGRIKRLNDDNFKIICNVMDLMAADLPYLDALPEEIRESVRTEAAR